MDILLFLVTKETEVDQEWKRNQRSKVAFETKRARNRH